MGTVSKSRTQRAAAIADLGTTTDLTGVDGTGNNAADLTTTESRLDDIETKVDAILAALRLAQVIEP